MSMPRSGKDSTRTRGGGTSAGITTTGTLPASPASPASGGLCTVMSMDALSSLDSHIRTATGAARAGSCNPGKGTTPLPQPPRGPWPCCAPRERHLQEKAALSVQDSSHSLPERFDEHQSVKSRNRSYEALENNDGSLEKKVHKSLEKDVLEEPRVKKHKKSKKKKKPKDKHWDRDSNPTSKNPIFQEHTLMLTSTALEEKEKAFEEVGGLHKKIMRCIYRSSPAMRLLANSGEQRAPFYWLLVCLWKTAALSGRKRSI